MSKQIVRTLTMLTLVAGLMLTAAVVAANGQSTSSNVTADIPFDFIVAGQTLPSGKYTVGPATSTSGTGTLKIRSRDGKSSAIRISNLVDERSQDRQARMVFHRYGQQYFLAEVYSGDNFGRQLLQCKMERNLRYELASNPSKNDSTKGSYEVIEVVALVR